MRVFFFFFFQAEDGIRDHCVTGVQTCALPICRPIPQRLAALLPLAREPMRYCRRFLAGIPHWREGHPRVPHPSATPAPPVGEASVRLACVRHAASVCPEPGSNSPSKLVLSPLSHLL